MSPEILPWWCITTYRYEGSAFDWMKQISQAAQPINSTG